MHRALADIHRIGLLCLLLSLIGLTGCQEQSQPLEEASKPIVAKPELHFEPKAGPQEVVFLTQSWTGGGGDPVLLGPGSGRTLYYKRRPVYVDSIAQDIIHKQLGKHLAGADKILVKAIVHLEPSSATISTDPPSRKRIYRVVIDELHHAKWY